MYRRYYVWMFEDNFAGVHNYYAADLVNRRPLQGKIVRPSRARQKQLGQRSVSTRMGKGLLNKLGKLGIK